MSEESRQPSYSGSVASHCSTALELAIRVVKQWDKHDKFRVTESDKALWSGDEPDDVAIARALIESDKAYGCELMDPAGTIWDQCAKYRDALIDIATVRDEVEGPSLDYMQGYRDGQEFLAKRARDTVV